MICLLIFGVTLSNNCADNNNNEIHSQYLLVGETTQTSAIFQSRLSARDTLIYEDLHNAESIAKADTEGNNGYARFEIAKSASFSDPIRTDWIEAEAEQDYTVKQKVNNLEPGTLYYYRLEYGTEKKGGQKYSKVHSFKTLPPEDSKSPVSFVMVTGTHLDRFYLGGGFGNSSSQGTDAYRENDKYLGFNGFETISQIGADFYIGNGDNVYYDHPPDYPAKTQEEMRAKWHRQFSMPRMKQMFSKIPTYWLKDDHDHRFDDSDTLEVSERFGKFPTHQLGVKTFIEQVPVVDPSEPDPVTYRTIKVNELLQLWMVEGRDYRSPNKMPDGPDKSIWGEEQKQWLKKTLLESDAEFKILVTPTPMVGPDGNRKIDNHTNLDGFRHEGDAFFEWLKANGFLEKNFYIITGDRHWQYHAIHPSGFEEFSCGAMVDQNARLGVDPGSPGSTDPEGLIEQPFTSPKPSGGFLKVDVQPEMVSFIFYDQFGSELYRTTKRAH